MECYSFSENLRYTIHSTKSYHSTNMYMDEGTDMDINYECSMGGATAIVKQRIGCYRIAGKFREV